MFASTMQSGTLMAFPDVCNTPTPLGPVPIPYPNIGQCVQANASTAAQKVKIVMKPALTRQSELPMTSGDEAGTAGGVVSGQNMGPAKFTSASTKVVIEGNPAVYLGCMTAQNGNNANAPSGAQIAPSQTKVLILG